MTSHKRCGLSDAGKEEETGRCAKLFCDFESSRKQTLICRACTLGQLSMHTGIV